MHTLAVVNDSPEQLEDIRRVCPGARLYAVSRGTRRRRLGVALPYGRRKSRRAQPLIVFDAGIDRHTVERLLENSKAGDTVLFDWGRTLAQVKGVDFRGIGEETAADDVLRWAIGGARRLAMLRRLFKGLRERGVKLGIVSNSDNCGHGKWARLIYNLAGTRRVSFMCGRGGKGRRLRARWPTKCKAVA
jgi:hypothetical protein